MQPSSIFSTCSGCERAVSLPHGLLHPPTHRHTYRAQPMYTTCTWAIATLGRERAQQELRPTHPHACLLCTQ